MRSLPLGPPPPLSLTLSLTLAPPLSVLPPTGTSEATARRLLDAGEKGEVGGVGRRRVGGGKRGAEGAARRGGWMARVGVVGGGML